MYGCTWRQPQAHCRPRVDEHVTISKNMPWPMPSTASAQDLQGRDHTCRMYMPASCCGWAVCGNTAMQSAIRQIHQPAIPSHSHTGSHCNMPARALEQCRQSDVMFACVAIPTLLHPRTHRTPSWVHTSTLSGTPYRPIHSQAGGTRHAAGKLRQVPCTITAG